MGIDPKYAVIGNLNDTGCDGYTREKFLQLHKLGKTEEQLRLLRKHRSDLLAAVHDNQKKIDCLDHLTFCLERDCSENRSALKAKNTNIKDKS